MNNDPTAPAPNDAPLRSSDELSDRNEHDHESGHIASTGHDSAHETETTTNTTGISTDAGISSAVPATTALKPWEERFAAKRKSALDSLFSTVDTLVYLELVTLYCFDISSTLLLLRLSTHISPLPSTLTLLPARLRPSIKNTTLFPIILVNLVAIIYHLVSTLPQAGEATRFDLQGHILVDFVGQRALIGWSGRARLLGLDLLVLSLQCLGCGVLAAGEKSGRVVVKESGAAGEGRGVAGHERSQLTEESEEGIELQPLMHSVGNLEGENVPGPSEVLDLEAQNHSNIAYQSAEQASSADADSVARDGLEALYAGQAVLVDICFWTLLRDQYYERRNRALAGRV